MTTDEKTSDGDAVDVVIDRIGTESTVRITLGSAADM